MTPRDQAAYDAGLRAALDMARTVAITMEAAPDAADLRKQAAVAALYGFAEGAETLALATKSSPPIAAPDTLAARPETH